MPFTNPSSPLPRTSEPVRGIYLIEVPFEDIYTAVFAVTDGTDLVLVDSATTADDVDMQILPALHALGFDGPPTALLLTHPHGDHAGGAKRLREHFPNLPVYCPAPLKTLEVLPVTEETPLPCGLAALSLPGHTATSVAYLHRPSGTLLSGDCLQQRGVSRYTNGIGYPEAYRASVERLRELPLARIIASHEYVPLGSRAEGREEIDRYLDECLRDCPK